MQAKKVSRGGLVVLLLKLGPKLLATLLPIVKSSAGLKAVGAVGSVGLYSYLWTWQMAVALVAFLIIHEYGHLWAMRQCSLRVRGVFLIPFLGAVAVSKDKCRSARDDAYVALMGPVFGFVGFVLPMTALYWYTGDGMWAAVAALMAFINLLNLFPVLPLDGGHILKALVYSERLMGALVTLAVITFFIGVCGIYFASLLLIFLAMIGMWDVAVTFGLKEHIAKLLRTITRVGGTLGALLLGKFFLSQWNALGDAVLAKEQYMDALARKESMPFALGDIFADHPYLWLIMTGALLCTLLVCMLMDIEYSTQRRRWSYWRFPIVVLLEARLGLRELRRLRVRHVQPIKGYEWMDTRTRCEYTTCFVGAIVIHLFWIVRLGTVPGAGFASQFLQ